MMFTVIMQSYITDDSRIEKLHRAISSVLGQITKVHFELLIIADGCDITFNEVSTAYKAEFDSHKPRLRLFKVSNDHKVKGKYYSKGRNTGLSYARGEWVLYLDNDDYYTNDYLNKLSKYLNGAIDWFIVDDFTWVNYSWKQRRCNLKLSHCGTANIIHKSTMVSRWPNCTSYGRDDWSFISNLRHESKNFRHLDIAGYCVCNIPRKYTK